MIQINYKSLGSIKSKTNRSSRNVDKFLPRSSSFLLRVRSTLSFCSDRFSPWSGHPLLFPRPRDASLCFSTLKCWVPPTSGRPWPGSDTASYILTSSWRILTEPKGGQVALGPQGQVQWPWPSPEPAGTPQQLCAHPHLHAVHSAAAGVSLLAWAYISFSLVYISYFLIPLLQISSKSYI